jgi:bacterial/archaeal transporter family protein
MQNALLLIGCMAAWGMAVFLMKLAGDRLGPYTSAVFALPGYILVGLFVAGKADYRIVPAHGIAVAIGALYMLGNMAFYKLSANTDVTTLAPITSVNIVIPIILGWCLLHEPFTPRRVAGIVFAIVAVYLLSAPATRPVLPAQ